MDTLLTLTHITILLVLGILFSLLSNKLKIPNTLFLLLTGMFIGNIEYQGAPLIEFPEIFITSIGILTLIMIVFDASNRFKWKEFDTLTMNAGKLATITFILNFLLLSAITYYFFELDNIFYAMIFSVVVSSTSPDLVLSLFKGTRHRIVDVLKFESIINTPLTVLFPFIILNFMNGLPVSPGLAQVKAHTLSFLGQIVTGVGAGVVIGVLVFKFMRKYYSEKLSPLMMITACLLTYILAEHLSGNGVLAVTVLGLMFGNLYIKEKDALSEFSGMFSNSLIILVFILLGLMIKIPMDWQFFLYSTILFLISVMIRVAAVFMTFPTTKTFKVREKMFCALNTPKGIASAVVAFSLFSTKSFLSMSAQTTLHLMLIFIIYSLVLSTVVSHYSKYFISVEVKQ